MKISLKVSADFEINETGPILHCDVQAEIDGDGPDVIALEKIGNEHMRQMARDAHEFTQTAAPVLFELLASLRGTGPDRPAGDTSDNRLTWLEEELLEHASRLNRLEQVVDGHGLAGMSERIGFLASGLQLVEARLPPIGWEPDSYRHEKTNHSLQKVSGLWTVYEEKTGRTLATGGTIHGALADLGE